jgi:hypothetical protein
MYLSPLGVTRSPGHPITRSSYHPVILSPGHPVILSPGHPVILSPGHSVLSTQYSALSTHVSPTIKGACYARSTCAAATRLDSDPRAAW